MSLRTCPNQHQTLFPYDCPECRALGLPTFPPGRVNWLNYHAQEKARKARLRLNAAKLVGKAWRQAHAR